MISGFDGRGYRNLGSAGHATVGERVAHGTAEIERAFAPVAALPGQPHGQLAGQGRDGLAQGGQFLPAGVHEVDVLGERLAQRFGHGLGPAVGDQPAADFGLDLPAQGVQAGLVLLLGQPFLQLGELPARLLAGRFHHSPEDGVKVELPEGAVQVVGATDRPARLHPGIAGHRGSGDGAHHGVVAVHQGPVEQLCQLLRGESFGATALALAGAEQIGDELVDGTVTGTLVGEVVLAARAARSTPRRRSRRPSSGRCF